MWKRETDIYLIPAVKYGSPCRNLHENLNIQQKFVEILYTKFTEIEKKNVVNKEKNL
jgi:hypothetical protein